MSRNFGIRRRHDLPREKLLSNHAEDVLLFLCILLFGGSLLLLNVEFPNGLSDARIAIVSSGR